MTTTNHTTGHPADEDLVLHFYGEEAGLDGHRIDEHLRSCDACRGVWTDLQQTMTLVDAAAVPEPGAAFERVVWARLQPALPAARPARASWWSMRVFVPAAGVAALVLGAFMVGRMWPASPAPAPLMTTGTVARDHAATRERVLLAALDEHFEQTQMLLVELMNDTGAAPDLGFERQTASDLVDSSRLYRETARQNGDVRLVQMLEDLESVLVEVARSPEHVKANDLRSLRAHIDADGLLFKVRAVAKEIRDRQKTRSIVTE